MLGGPGRTTGSNRRIEISGSGSNGRMPPLSRRALLATVVAGSSSGVAGCNALSKDSSSTPTSSDGFGGIPLYVAEGVPLPDGADVVTVDDPVGGHVALFPADLSDTEGALYALAGSTPVAVVGRDAQDTLMDICAADGRSYGFASNSWGPGTRVAAAVPLGDSLVTHLFNGSKIPNSLPQVSTDSGIRQRPVAPSTRNCQLSRTGSTSRRDHSVCPTSTAATTWPASTVEILSEQLPARIKRISWLISEGRFTPAAKSVVMAGTSPTRSDLKRHLTTT